MATCPNINLDSWKNLLAARGEDLAYYLWDKYDGNVPESESKSEIVKAGLKATNALQSEKGIQLFNTLQKNKVTGDAFWNKLQQDLQIPKEQIELLKQYNTTDREQLITNMLADYSFAIEINLGRSLVSRQTRYFQDENQMLEEDVDTPYNRAILQPDGRYKVILVASDGSEFSPGIFTKEEAIEDFGESIFEGQKSLPKSDYYSNLTVPGGTNYTENEIATPAITPSIKGHAQFATDKGIGWFRSDDQFSSTLQSEEETKAYLKKGVEDFKAGRITQQEFFDIRDLKNIGFKTRRILEVQSDLFQKGRDKEQLVGSNIIRRGDSFFEIKPGGEEIRTTYTRAKELGYTEDQEKLKKLKTLNQFLQLLNKDNNWVTFFIKSIIQDSAKKGYEKVIFPTGSTAYKIESGGNTIEDFIKNKEDRLKQIKESYHAVNINGSSVYGTQSKIDAENYAKDRGYEVVSGKDLKANQNEINRLEKEISDAKEGASGLAATAKFYETTVANVLKKQGYNPKVVTDEYGNTWNEVTVSPERESARVLFQTEEIPASRASEETLSKVKKVLEKMGVKTQALVDYAKAHPDMDVTSVNGVADLVKGVIAIAEGREDVALTEEMVHMATAILEQTNPKLVTEMIAKIDRFAIYQKTLDAYKNNKNYQLANGKPDIRKIKKEAVDKLIAELIINQSEGDTEFPELRQEANRSLIRRWWNAITDAIRGMYRKSNISIFEEAARTISTGELGARYGQVKEGVSELFESNPELASIGTPQQYSAYLDSIFPDSKVKDIFVHVSRTKGIEKLRINNAPGNFINSQVNGKGIYFAPVDYADYWDMELGLEGKGVKYFAVLNSQNPQKLTKNYVEDKDVNSNTDAVLNYSRVNPQIIDEVIVKDADIIHILGNKQDIEGFKEFVKTAPATFKGEGVLFQLTDAQKNTIDKINAQQDNIEKVVEKKESDPLLLDSEEANNYYRIKQPDGTFVNIAKRVTDRVKAWYAKRFGSKEFTPEEKAFNNLKREYGVKYHGFFEEIHARYFNSDGSRKASPDARPAISNTIDQEVYDKIEKYYTELINLPELKDAAILSEVMIYDPKQKEAGTIDFLAIDKNGKAHVLDWKFMYVADDPRIDDVAWFKQGAYNIQLGRYKEILRENYGIKEFGMLRAIPFLMKFQRENPKDYKSKMIIKGIVAGSADKSKIENLKLMPVAEETESTGFEKLDSLIKKLNALISQIGSEEVTDETDREFKIERMNTIRRAVRIVQGSMNIAPLIDVIEVMRKDGEKILEDYNTTYKNRPSTREDFKDKDLSDFSEELDNYIKTSTMFSDISKYIGKLIYSEEMEAKAKTKEEKEEVQLGKDVLLKLINEQERIKEVTLELTDAANNFADKHIGERNLVGGLTKAEAVVKGLSSIFRGISELPMASLKVLYKLVTSAKSKAMADALTEVEELMEIRKKIASSGKDLRKTVKQLYQSDKEGGIVNKLIYKYKKEFYDTLKEKKESGGDKKWLLANINIEEYKKEAEAKMNENIDKIKKRRYAGTKEQEQETRDDLILQEKRRWDIGRKDFNGWDNYILKRHPKDEWFSDEYKNVQKDPDLLQLYNFVTKFNQKAKEVGYIDNKVASIFLPFVRKSMAEGLAWDNSLSVIQNFGNSLKIQAEDVGYGRFNEITGELENSIPKYYTKDFSNKGNGVNDYSEVSEDLFKNLILYIQHVNKYKYMSDIEGQLKLVKTIEEFKGHLATGRTGNIVKKDGSVQKIASNVENTKLFDDFLRTLLYEQKYVLSDSDTPLHMDKVINGVKKLINKVAGKEIWKDTDSTSATSLVKTMDAANRVFQLKTLGLDPISGAVNAFGANIQISTQAGAYFKSREFLKNEFKLMGMKFNSKEEQQIFIQSINTFMPMKDDPSYELLKKAGMTAATRGDAADFLMFFMRFPEQLVEKSVFETLMENMMVDNGKIISIREFVKSKYKGRTQQAGTYRETKAKIESEIEKLKQTSSIAKTRKLENGKLVIPGLDLNNREELQRLTNLTRTISRNATGGMSDSDVNRMSMSVWTKSMMIFRNWIPKLADTRFSEFRKVSDDFSVRINDEGELEGEKYDIGRLRLLGHVLMQSISTFSNNINHIMVMNEKGVKLIDEMYEEFAKKYEEQTGQKMTMDRDEFADMIRNNIRNQMKELLMLGTLVGTMFTLGFIAPDDDDDKATKNAFRYTQRVVDKFVGELSFFYNPVNFEQVLSGSTFPALGITTDFYKVMSNFFMETTGYDFTDPTKTPEEIRKSAQPIKRAIKMIPAGRSFLTWLSMIDSEFAKEYDITIQKETSIR